MPGSPPIRTSDPVTTPPPRTRSSSAMPLDTRCPLPSREISRIGWGRLEVTPGRAAPRAGATRSSTSCT